MSRHPSLRGPIISLALALTFRSPFSAVELCAQRPPIERTVDATIRPGDDFFAFANGAWLAAAVIPPGRDRWSVRDEIAERTREQIAALLNGARGAPSGSLARKVADFRAALLDRASIEARGLSGIRQALSDIDRATDKVAIARLLGASMRADVDPLNIGIYRSSSVLGLSVEHSIHGETGYTAFLVQGGLALGSRDAYLNADSAAMERRTRYHSYVARMLSLAGYDRADQRADAVLALETSLAKTQATDEASAIDRNADNEWPLAEFAREAPGMDWRAFFASAGLASQQTIVAWQPTAVKGLAALVATTPLESWKNYLRFHAIDEFVDDLPRDFTRAAAELRGDRPEPEARALNVTQAAMAGAIGALYANRYFSAAQKARVDRIVANVAAAFRQHVAHASWLSESSRKTALAKLDALYVGIGYPETSEDWSDLTIDPHDALGNRRRVAARNRAFALARLSRPFDRHEWVLPPHTAGAVLIFQQNAYTFTAALLQAPKYDSTMSDAAAYGAIGAIIGHDISHFVDVLGADYGPDGRMRRWWTPDDSSRFDAAALPLVRQFSEYHPLPGVSVDGRLTRTENVADLAGLTAAFEAHRASLGARARDTAYVHRADREFFIAFAQAFAAKTTDAGMRAQLATDHAPEAYRFDTVRNIDAWYDAFDVVAGQRLYLAPSARVHVW